MNFTRLAYLASYFLKAKTGRKQPILAGIKLTHRCTLRCGQCPYWRRESADLSWEQLTSLFPRLYRDGIRIVILEGGEPLLWRDGERTLQDVVDLAKRYFYTVGVTTNGTLPLEVAADAIWVSIDGLQETHDRLRGPSFERIMGNIAVANQKWIKANPDANNQPRIFANITINRYNVQEIPELVRFLCDKVRGITIQFFYPYAESDDMTCSWEDRSWVLEQLQQLKQEGLPVMDSLAALEVLKNNNWSCEHWMMANVDPDGSYTQGCYLKNRTDSPACHWCGFAAHTEISLAYQLNVAAVRAGRDILGIF